MILQELANFHPIMAILIKQPSSDFDWKIIAKLNVRMGCQQRSAVTNRQIFRDLHLIAQIDSMRIKSGYSIAKPTKLSNLLLFTFLSVRVDGVNPRGKIPSLIAKELKVVLQSNGPSVH